MQAWLLVVLVLIFVSRFFKMPEGSALIQRGTLIKISHYLRNLRHRRGGFDMPDGYIDMIRSTCRSRAAHISFLEDAHSRNLRETEKTFVRTRTKANDSASSFVAGESYSFFARSGYFEASALIFPVENYIPDNRLWL